MSIPAAISFPINGTASSLGLSANTLIYTGAGKVNTVSITTAGAAGALYDAPTVATIGADNLIAVVPATVELLDMNSFPFAKGLVYEPGSAQVVSIAYTPNQTLEPGIVS